MSLCRLCSNTELVLDLFDESIDHNIRKKWRLCIKIATGLKIQRSDRVSKMVCHSCCSIVKKMYRFRMKAIANDRLLKEQMQSSETTSPALEGTSCMNDSTTASVIASISRKIDAINEIVPALVNRHASVNRLLERHPNIILPKNVNKCDINPVVSLDESDVKDWYEQYFIMCQQRLALTNIKIKRVISSDYANEQKCSVASDSNSELSNYIPTTYETLPSTKLNNTVQINKIGLSVTRISKPCPKSKKPYFNSKKHCTTKSGDVPSETLQSVLEEAIIAINEDLQEPDVCKTQINDISTTTVEQPAIPKKKRKPKSKQKFSEFTSDETFDEVIPEKKKRIYFNRNGLAAVSKMDIPENIPDNPTERKELLASSLGLAPITKQKDAVVDEEQVFACKICLKLYDTNEELQLHLKRHLTCRYCKVRMPSMKHLKLHENQSCYKFIKENQPQVTLTKVNKITSVVDKYPSAFKNDDESNENESLSSCNTSSDSLPTIKAKEVQSLQSNISLEISESLDQDTDIFEQLLTLSEQETSTSNSLPPHKECKTESGPLSKIAFPLDPMLSIPDLEITDEEIRTMLGIPLTLENLPNTTFHHGSVATPNTSVLQTSFQMNSVQKGVPNKTDYTAKQPLSNTFKSHLPYEMPLSKLNILSNHSFMSKPPPTKPPQQLNQARVPQQRTLNTITMDSSCDPTSLGINYYNPSQEQITPLNHSYTNYNSTNNMYVSKPPTYTNANQTQYQSRRTTDNMQDGSPNNLHYQYHTKNNANCNTNVNSTLGYNQPLTQTNSTNATVARNTTAATAQSWQKPPTNPATKNYVLQPNLSMNDSTRCIDNSQYINPVITDQTYSNLQYLRQNHQQINRNCHTTKNYYPQPNGTLSNIQNVMQYPAGIQYSQSFPTHTNTKQTETMHRSFPAPNLPSAPQYLQPGLTQPINQQNIAYSMPTLDDVAITTVHQTSVNIRRLTQPVSNPFPIANNPNQNMNGNILSNPNPAYERRMSMADGSSATNSFKQPHLQKSNPFPIANNANQNMNGNISSNPNPGYERRMSMAGSSATISFEQPHPQKSHLRVRQFSELR